MDFQFIYVIFFVIVCYFCFEWIFVGSELGSEDLDVVKWKLNLKINDIVFYMVLCIYQWEGKVGLVWCVVIVIILMEIFDVVCV